MSIQASNNKINSLQGLRVIAFLGVFLTHSEIKEFGPLGIQSVSIFYILSGFVMLLSYYKKIDSKISALEAISYLHGTRYVVSILYISLLQFLCSFS